MLYVPLEPKKNLPADETRGIEMNATAIGIRDVMKDSRILNHLFMTMYKYHPCKNVKEN